MYSTERAKGREEKLLKRMEEGIANIDRKKNARKTAEKGRGKGRLASRAFIKEHSKSQMGGGEDGIWEKKGKKCEGKKEKATGGKGENAASVCLWKGQEIYSREGREGGECGERGEGRTKCEKQGRGNDVLPLRGEKGKKFESDAREKRNPL